MAVALGETSLGADANLKGYWRFDGNSNDAKGTYNGTDTAMSYSSAAPKFVQNAVFAGTPSLLVCKAITAPLPVLGSEILNFPAATCP